MKNNINLIVKIFMFSIFFSILNQTAFADRLDKYVDILRNNQYTIVYTFNTKNNAYDERTGMVGLDINSDLNQILIKDLDHAIYSETCHGSNNVLNCYLYKEGELYQYFKTRKKDIFKYYGDIEPLGPMDANIALKFHGGNLLFYLNYILAINLQDSMWKIEKVGDSINSEGYNCEDYKKVFMNNSAPAELIRFIFDKDDLIEMDIASVSTPTKIVIKFSKFTNEIDKELLEFPKGLKMIKIPKELIEASERAKIINEKRRKKLGLDNNGSPQVGNHVIIGGNPDINQLNKFKM